MDKRCDIPSVCQLHSLQGGNAGENTSQHFSSIHILYSIHQAAHAYAEDLRPLCTQEALISRVPSLVYTSPTEEDLKHPASV